MCGCNKDKTSSTYVVTRSNGTTAEFSSKVQADIEATRSNGKITVKKK